MATIFGQENRFLEIKDNQLGKIAVLKHIEGEEQLSHPYVFQATLRSVAKWSDIESFIGKPIAFRINESPNQRIIHGILTELQQQGFEDGQFNYLVRIEPWLKMLTLTRNLRVYQRVSVPDMISDIFRKRGFSDFELKLKNSYKPREFCMQYKESDFDFVTRQLEEAGIFYYFRHEESKHTLVLADHHSAFANADISSLPYQSKQGSQKGYGLRALSIHRSMVPSAVVMNGYNVQKAEAEAGSAKVTDKKFTKPQLSIYDIRRHEEKDELEKQAELCMAQWETNSYYVFAQNTAIGLQVGQQFKLTGHPSADGSYAIAGQRLEAASNVEGQFSFSSNVTLFPADKDFRPAPSVSRPYISGVISALVVGASSEEIHTDNYGRIKVQFHWDKENKKDDSSSCWIRVSQLWNGAKFGSQFIPRVGSEVLVSFIDGDPDSPLVTGTVYNGVKTPPFALPGQKTQSGFATRSSSKGTVEEGHQLCFEDKKGEEFILLHSQKDMHLEAKNDYSAKIGRNVLWEIEEKRDTELKKGNDTLILTEGNALTELKKGNKEHKIDRGNFNTTVSMGSYNLTVSKGSAKIDVGQTCTISAHQAINLEVGGSKISITPAGITIKAPTVTVEGSGKLDLKSSGMATLSGSMVTVEGKGVAQFKGAIVQINASGIATVKGSLTMIG